MKYLLTFKIKVLVMQNCILFNRLINVDCGSVSKVIECSVDSIEGEIEKLAENVSKDFKSNEKDKDVRVVVTLMHIIPIS